MAGMFDGFGFGVEGPGAVDASDMSAAQGGFADMAGTPGIDLTGTVDQRGYDTAQNMDWGGTDYGRYGSWGERTAEKMGMNSLADAIRGTTDFMDSPKGRGMGMAASIATGLLTGAFPAGAFVGGAKLAYDAATGKIQGENTHDYGGDSDGPGDQPITPSTAKTTGQAILDQIYGEEKPKPSKRQLIPYGNDERQYGYGSEHNYFTNNFADGGAVMGPGTGMSDSIPATINGQQPAALSDGEFVVPADVVSAIGDGSSKAGVSKLYEFLERIRQEKGMDGQPPPLQKSLEQLLMSTRT